MSQPIYMDITNQTTNPSSLQAYPPLTKKVTNIPKEPITNKNVRKPYCPHIILQTLHYRLLKHIIGFV